MKNKFSRAMGKQFAEAAHKAGAVAPQWMVHTVDAQAARGGGVFVCYQKSSCLRMTDVAKSPIFIGNSSGVAANQIRWRQMA